MTLLGFILDGVIVVLLGAVIFFSVQLSLALRTFRDNRTELRGLVESLSRAILQADGAIKGLREAARDSGRDLQGAISEARSIQDELRIMIESGDSLARRIESAVDQGRPASYRQPPREPDRNRPLPPAASPPDSGGFLIRDRDYDTGEAPVTSDLQEEDTDGEDRFASRAERDLYEALKKKGAPGRART